MDQIIPISQARNQLPSLVEEVSQISNRILITVKGKVKAALVNAEEYEDMTDTLEILSDPETMAAIRESEADLKAGRTIPWEEVKKELGIPD